MENTSRNANMMGKILVLVGIISVFKYPSSCDGSDAFKKAAWPYIKAPFSFPTPSPINFNSSMARPFFMIPPRILHINLSISDVMTNSGNGVRVRPNPLTNIPGSWYTYGGVMWPSVYDFIEAYFLWNNNNNRPSGTIFDGKSTPFEVVGVYVNRKYKTIQNALSHRDGLTLVPVIVRVLQGADNPLFTPLVNLVKQLTNPGKSVLLSREILLGWIDQKMYYSSYYAYPGGFNDTNLDSTSQQANCATVIIRSPVPGPWISVNQLATFQKLRNQDGMIYDNNVPTYPQNGRPIVVTGPMIQLSAH